jgi:heparanase
MVSIPRSCIALSAALMCAYPANSQSPLPIDPATLARAGTVNERFQSFNVEMLEVTGGKFWKPYGPSLEAALHEPKPAASSGRDTPAGMNPALYEYRPPLDLANSRLRRLAAALGPTYVRVSGTWANTTYLADSDQASKNPPAGFMGVLTKAQWKGVVDFARAVDAQIVTSFATGVGTRDAEGIWTPVQARRFLALTKSLGGSIAAAEFMNEPNFAAMGGAPAGYTAEAYGRDFKVFRSFAREAAPDLLILGPGSVGETTGNWGVAYGVAAGLKTRDMLAASGPGLDAFSYHHYGASSQRCAAMGAQTTAAGALSEAWLARTDQTLAFYQALRDEFAPGKPFWLTETADSACGGNPWASTFLDSFRYIDQLGRLAKQDVHVVIHNTLVASDYGLLDEHSLMPKPNYWAGWLWRHLMGTTVLESGIPIQAGMHVYAHCLRGVPGGVALLVINTDSRDPRVLSTPTPSIVYALTARQMQDKEVLLNGKNLSLRPDDRLPELTGNQRPSGPLRFGPRSISFVGFAKANNNSCR